MAFTRRHLPHLHFSGRQVFVTIRLHGSMPPGRSFHERCMDSGRAFVSMDRLMHDYRCGPAYFQQPLIAGVLANCIFDSSREDMDLHEWVIMPNHAHILITPHTELPAVMRRIKGVSAREANRILNLTGRAFWQPESYDRLVRDEDEFRRTQRYIVMNPVHAGLAANAGEYMWSSVGRWREARDLPPKAELG
jgi:putative DNA methylase